MCMLKKSFIAILALLGFGAATAQTPINDLIFAEINNTASQYYYPTLMMRYEATGDLTDEEYHYLYYGYAFQPLYKPLDTNPGMDRVQAIISRLAIDTPSVTDIDELIAAGSEAMERDPFSPKLLNIMAYAYGTSGDTVREKQ